MPDIDITETNLKSLKSLRKILAGRGDIQGNFYFAGDTRGKEAGIVITISTRDTNGAKALSRGRPLRQAITGSKFAKGIVRAPSNRVWLEIVAGNANPTVLTKSFKRAFTDPALKKLKAILKKARIGVPTEAEILNQDEGARAAAEDAMSDLSAEDRRDIQRLIAQKEQINAANIQLKESFLAQAKADEEEAEDRQAILDKIQELMRNSPGDPQILELRYGLTEMIYDAPNVYENEFPSIGEPLSPEMASILQTQVISNVNTLLEQLQELSEAITSRLTTTQTKAEDIQPDYGSQMLDQVRDYPARAQAIHNLILNMTR